MSGPQEFISEAEHLVAALEQRKQDWLNYDGSGRWDTRAGYIEAINDAKAVVEEFYRQRGDE